jgi:hypothetical protein
MDTTTPPRGAPAGWHFLGLPDASVVATHALLATHDALADLFEQRAMMCVYGDTGSGKTLAVRASLATLAPEATCYLALRSRPDPAALRHELYQVLGLPGQPPRRHVQLDAQLSQALSAQVRVLVCDNAQLLTTGALRYLSSLWDDEHPDVAIVLIGTGRSPGMLCSQPELASRVHTWIPFTAMTEREVLQVIPVFHPVWRDAQAALLLFGDAYARGNFRRWAALTGHVLNVLKRQLPGIPVDEPLVRLALARLGAAA